MFSEGLLTIGYRSMSTNESKYVGCQNRILSENCPKICIGKLSNSSRRRMSNGLFRRVVQQFTSEGCPQSKQIDLFGNNFIHGTSMCERVSEDSRHGIGHIDIRVGIMNSLECVYLPLHEYLGGE